MADIDVVPKRRTGVWLWVILAIVVVAILWMALGRGSAPRTSRNLAPASFTSMTLSGAAAELVA